MSAPELLVVALEASADLHGAAVLRELRALQPELRVFGAGGPRMRQEGLEALVRAEDISVMGIAEVIPALPRILDAMDMLYDAARERRPRAALLIDSPDFNLRLARRLRMHRIPVAYFIGPSVWAWRTRRVRQIARDVARMLVTYPPSTSGTRWPTGCGRPFRSAPSTACLHSSPAPAPRRSGVSGRRCWRRRGASRHAVGVCS